MCKLTYGNFETAHHANLRFIASFHEDSEWIIDGGTSEHVFSSKINLIQNITTINCKYSSMMDISKWTKKKQIIELNSFDLLLSLIVININQGLIYRLP